MPTPMTDSVDIGDISKGDLVWECERGRDALLFALADAERLVNGWRVQTVDVATGESVHLFRHDRNHAYGPKLYNGPQYTMPDYPLLLKQLAALVIR